MIDAAAILAARLARAGEEDVLERTKDQQDPVTHTNQPGVIPMKVTKSPSLNQSDVAEGVRVPNPDRTHVAAPRVRLYVATPRSAA